MVLDDLYHASAEVVKQALLKEKSLRSAVYSSKFQNKKQLLRICCETLKHREYLDRVLACAPLKELLKEPEYKHFSLLYVLLYEFLVGNGLRRCSKKLCGPIFALKDIILQQAELQKDAFSISTEGPSSSFDVQIPKYGRINTLKWTMDDAIKALVEDEWIVKETPLSNEEDLYKKSIAEMKFNEIFVDQLIENLLLFPPGTDIHDYWMVEQGYIILQDKASCLSAFILNPKDNSQVIDVCAAPGMKTSHLAAILANKGKIWAMDKAKDRVETLRATLERTGAANVSVFCGDCLRLDVNDKKFSKIQYALVDPPCSGSGIVKRMDLFINNADDFNEKRLRSLSNLQAMILKHVMRLPALKKVVYSTCSVYSEENEQVVQEVLNDEEFGRSFKLIKALPAWSPRGSSDYSFGKKCLRAVPEVNLTNGFFVAVFKRRKTSDKK